MLCWNMAELGLDPRLVRLPAQRLRNEPEQGVAQQA